MAKATNGEYTISLKSEMIPVMATPMPAYNNDKGNMSPKLHFPARYPNKARPITVRKKSCPKMRQVLLIALSMWVMTLTSIFFRNAIHNEGVNMRNQRAAHTELPVVCTRKYTTTDNMTAG